MNTPKCFSPLSVWHLRTNFMNLHHNAETLWKYNSYMNQNTNSQMNKQASWKHIIRRIKSIPQSTPGTGVNEVCNSVKDVMLLQLNITTHHDIKWTNRYSDVIMSVMASQITSLTIVYSTIHSGADQGKHQSSASLAFVWGIYRWPVNSLHKGPVTWKMFPFDDIIMWMYWAVHSKDYIYALHTL